MIVLYQSHVDKAGHFSGAEVASRTWIYGSRKPHCMRLSCEPWLTADMSLYQSIHSYQTMSCSAVSSLVGTRRID